MYIGYLKDRQKLGFINIKNIHVVKHLFGLKSTISIPGI